MTARKLCALLLAGLATLGTAAYAGEQDAAKATVEKLHQTLLEVMKNGKTLGYGGRYRQLEPVLKESFDFETIARVAAGRYWAALTDDKRAQYLGVFEKLSISTYADNFSSFGGERFETKAVEDKRGTPLVKTALVKSDGNEVTLNYLVGNKRGSWQIVNVIADGVSDLSLKRVEYTAVIGRDGIDSLIAKLNDKIASYEAQNQ